MNLILTGNRLETCKLCKLIPNDVIGIAESSWITVKIMVSWKFP